MTDADLDALLARLDETQNPTLTLMAMNLPALCADAAAAIRALQSDLAQCRKDLCAIVDDRTKHALEIARLSADLAQCRDAFNAQAVELSTARGEASTLRFERDTAAAEIEWLRAERERTNAALIVAEVERMDSGMLDPARPAALTPPAPTSAPAPA